MFCELAVTLSRPIFDGAVSCSIALGAVYSIASSVVVLYCVFLCIVPLFADQHFVCFEVYCTLQIFFLKHNRN